MCLAASHSSNHPSHHANCSLPLLLLLLTAPDEEGKPITSRRSIALNYLTGWFWLDVISSIPFDLLVASDYRLVALLKVGLAGWNRHPYSLTMIVTGQGASFGRVTPLR